MIVGPYRYGSCWLQDIKIHFFFKNNDYRVSLVRSYIFSRNSILVGLLGHTVICHLDTHKHFADRLCRDSIRFAQRRGKARKTDGGGPQHVLSLGTASPKVGGWADAEPILRRGLICEDDDDAEAIYAGRSTKPMRTWDLGGQFLRSYRFINLQR